MSLRSRCPSCSGTSLHHFYSLPEIPTNSCLLIDDRAKALSFSVAALELNWCRDCGFIFNAAWEPARTAYSQAYEETQGFSATFNGFHDRLARELISRHELRRKRVVEIGCGKGEFLTLLCRLGENEGIGYDPSFVPSRLDPAVAHRVTLFREFFDRNTKLPPCDLVCCKMTLEHIPDVYDFLSGLRQAMSEHDGTQVFFQVPNMKRILEEGAFWDIYYEHCSYFTPESLANLFVRCGFAVTDVWTDYDEQYLMIEARPAAQSHGGMLTKAERLRLAGLIESFVQKAEATKAEWVRGLREAASSGRRTALWGSGSKAVAFLTSLSLQSEILCAVDINPFRQRHYLPMTGHSIVSPDDLGALSPDSVIVLNPVYREEVQAALELRGLTPELHTLGTLPP